MQRENDLLTIAAIGLLAMCVVTFDHEALGHGSACLFLHGRIVLLTSSIFRCDVRSGWIDPAGPAGNLLMGTLALIIHRFVPIRRPKIRLFLLLVTALSFFWEGGYLIKAMHDRDGDLYFFAAFLLGNITDGERWAAMAAGLALYIVAIRLASNALLDLWPDARVARKAARTVWVSATLGALAAALVYTGQGWGDLRDAFLEIGLSSVPLLFIPTGTGRTGVQDAASQIPRSPFAIALAAAVFALFVATLGRGVAIG